jgi:galactokinase
LTTEPDPTRRYRAPGRVNLIGEHTDYNDGFVMPVAIDRYTTVVARLRTDRRVFARSDGYDRPVDIDLGDPGPPAGAWSDYVRGVVAVLERSGQALHGADLSFASDVPAGAGLSSSAALEVAAGFALLSLSGRSIDRTALALACQQAEHEYAGTRCGLMDQFIACHGRAGHAVLLDTRTLDAVWLPLPPDIQVVVCNTMTRHALASDGYNERRADCEAAVRALAVRLPRIRALRDVSYADLEANRDVLPDEVYRRCRHVVTENARTLSAADALRDGEIARFGVLMGASHASLRDDYEVSTRELDTLVDVAMEADGTIGARMTGGGFGGCTVNLVRADALESFTAHVRVRYHAHTGRMPEIYSCAAADGVREDVPEGEQI